MPPKPSVSKYRAATVLLLALGFGLPANAADEYTFTMIADSRGAFSFIGYEPPSINAGGTVAFAAMLDAGGQGVFKGTGAVPNAVTTIADSSGSFSRFSGPSINAGGTVAFRATLDAGGQGIFTG